ncbi:NADH_oxidase [Hexamita inflata]|uniref:NADH oxidase n=1 Tax=Hexamita inflata TaxID=28002 RepID=A0AA86NXX8_9EUKA|nr:NADH oxidase [Hexamita inflata]
MRVVIVGCTHAGTAVAMTLKQQDPSIEITAIEKNTTVSFLSCGIAIGAQHNIPMNKMFYNSVENMRSLGIKLFMQHEATSVDYATKTVHVSSMTESKTFSLQYDKLIISCGSAPIIPRFAAQPIPNVMLCKNFAHAETITKYVQEFKNTGKSVSVLGGGYIGIELCETFAENGFKVDLIEGEDRIMKKYFDPEFTTEAQNMLVKYGCNLHLGQLVEAITPVNGKITLKTQKEEIQADAVVLCIGFRPNTDMFVKSAVDQKVDLQNNRGVITVNDYAQTSVPDIYAVGDAACVKYFTGENRYIPLATNAVRQAIAASAHILGVPIKLQTSQGTSCIKVFDMGLASTGLTLADAKVMYPGEVSSTNLKTKTRPEFLDVQDVEVKLVYKTKGHQLLGVQISAEKAGELIQTASLLVQYKSTLEEIILTDFQFNPWYGKPQHCLQEAATLAAFGVEGEKFE